MLKKVLLYYHTIRYLKPVQIYGRVFAKIKSKIPKKYYAPDSLETELKVKTNFIAHDPWNSREELIKGKFTFLNEVENSSFPPKWHPEKGLLWKFNLQYFHYLHLLEKSEKEKLVLNWIKNNPVGHPVSWHPYVISLRLINWIKEDFKDPQIINSIYVQADYLYDNLEYYHPANHYLENAKTLIISGEYFKREGKAKWWYEKGKKIVVEQLPKQILKDGGYFELTPMYHGKMLEGLLDLVNVCEDKKLLELLNNYIFKMLKFHIACTHPSGDIALFNDSTVEITTNTKSILDYAKKLGFDLEINNKISGFSSYPDSGFYIYNSDSIYFIIKAGKIGPDEIPAHAHADLLSYELSFKNEQFIVDSGVYNYLPGEMREYCRSTKAHNTVDVDCIDQCEVWSGHRVARRYSVRNVQWMEIDEGLKFSGKYSGYKYLIGDQLEHLRAVKISAKGDKIRILDEITGRGNHIGYSYIHLHPQVSLAEKEEKLLLKKNESEIELVIGSNYVLSEGWYCPEFGKRIKNKVLKIPIEVNSSIEYSFLLN